MMQYKLPLTVNKGRRKRAAPISNDQFGDPGLDQLLWLLLQICTIPDL